MNQTHSPLKTFVKLSALAIATFTLLATASTAEASDAGKVVVWGYMGGGPPTLSSCTAIAGSFDHIVALQEDGTVVCWGSNSNGQCNVPVNLGACKAVTAGGYSTAVIKANGLVKAWGQVNYDVAELGVCTQIAAGSLHIVTLQSDGTVKAFGAGTTNTGINPDYGQSMVPADLGVCIQIAAGSNWSMALQSNGTVRAWGQNNIGQCNIPADLGVCIRIAAGENHAAALRSNGTVRAWGYNAFGQCNVPSDLGECTQIAVGGFHTIALQANGLVRAWGAGSTHTGNSPDYDQSIVPPDLGVCIQIAGGYNSSIAIQAPISTITGVLPISGPTTGGTTIAITGTNFHALATVTIGGAPATNVVVISPTKITAVTPPGSPGLSSVAVNSAMATAFYYRPNCGSDLNDDGEVDGADLGIMLLDYGTCQ